MKPTSDSFSSPSGLPGEVTGLSGDLPAGQIVIVASRYNAEVCNSMPQAAIDSLKQAGVAEEHILLHRVPGAWELPLAVQSALDDSKTIGAIALGAVIPW